MKTDKQMKEEWINALRSGDYTQTKGTLKGNYTGGDPIGYCCLGVFCSINGKEPEVELNVNATGEEGDIHLYRDCRAAIPEDIVSAGIEMNDHGYKFDEIADMIERDWVITP